MKKIPTPYLMETFTIQNRLFLKMSDEKTFTNFMTFGFCIHSVVKFKLMKDWFGDWLLLC